MTSLIDDTITERSEFLALAASCGSQLDENADRYDRDGSWARESFEYVRERGLLALGVPVELGGPGATISDLAAVQRELAKHCGSTALASSMHQHVTAFTAWRWRRGLPGAEATLRRINDEGIVLVSTGGADFTDPRGSAERVDGGYRVSGRKIFVSQSPSGTVMSTMFTYDDPERGLRVLNMAVPLSSPGVQVLETWDAMGMRGTASNDVELNDVFVPDERVLADRPHGVVDPPLQVIVSIAFPIISAVYLGIAEGVRDHVLTLLRDRCDDVIVQRQVGLIDARLRVAGWALDGVLRAVGDDPQPSLLLVADVMTMKREVALAGIEVCDLAMELAGGTAYFKGSPIERAYRDIRACKFHPFTPEATLVHGGRLALGLDA
jgi:alkylation response protein AidB-like acyl-CoA dehydrogenase